MSSPAPAHCGAGENVAHRAGFCAVIVEGLTAVARIGVNDHEQGIKQPLIVTVRILIESPTEDRIDQTFDYGDVRQYVDLLASEHFQLIETFAQRLARLCLVHPLAISADVTVSKPCGLSNGLAKCQVLLARDMNLLDTDAAIVSTSAAGGDGYWLEKAS